VNDDTEDGEKDAKQQRASVHDAQTNVQTADKMAAPTSGY